MKAKILFAVMLILPIMGIGQNMEKREIPEIKVTPPEFTGIENVNLMVNKAKTDVLKDFLYKNIEYPEDALEWNEQGTAVVRFVVTADGKLTDFTIINSVSSSIDNELVRVLKQTDGMWMSGYNNNNPVDMEKEVSIWFVASNTNSSNPAAYFTKLAKKSWLRGTTLYVEKNNPKKALKFYNESVKYLPYDPATLLLRGFCKYELGDREGARSDWERVSAIGKYDADELIQNLADLPGYDEMKLVLNK